MLERLLEGWRGVWLLPFIHVALEKSVFRVSDIVERLGVRASLVKSAVYSLRRAGIVERRGEGVYALREGVAEEYARMFKRVYMDGHHYLAYTGSHYLYARIARSRVSSWVLPEYIVERVARIARENPDLRPSEIGRMLGFHGRVVSRALLVLRLLSREEMVEDESGLGDGA